METLAVETSKAIIQQGGILGAIIVVCFLFIGALVYYAVLKQGSTQDAIKVAVEELVTIAKESKEHYSETIGHERNRSEECYDKMVSRVDKHEGESVERHSETVKKLDLILERQSNCAQCQMMREAQSKR
jgi:biopolymer transport protein ExbB/TolQ